MSFRRTPFVLALAALSLAGALSACAPLMLGGAAVGALITVDRRTAGAQVEDEGIELRGASRLRDALGERGHVSVTSYNRQVLLTGEVPNEQAKQTAEQIVSRVENVRGIVNELVATPNASLAERSNDALLTGKVKASIVDDKQLYIGAFKVITERGTVYLMGRVTAREADRATQIARNVGGVRRVVRVFEIIGDQELRNMAGSTEHTPVTPAPVTAVPVTPAPAAAPAPPPAAIATPVR